LSVVERTRVIIRISVAVAAIGALALAAPVAEAQNAGDKPAPQQRAIGGGKLFTRTATATPVVQNQVATATAECPAKTKAVAGGFATTPPFIVPLPNPAAHYLNVYESQLVGTDQWRVSAVQYLGNFDSLTAYVYCQSRKRLPTELFTVSLPTAVHGAGEAVVSCDGKGKVLSGGFLTEPPSTANGAVVTASHRDSKTAWSASATRIAPNPAVPPVPPLTLTAFAYCAKVPPIRQRSETVPVVGPTGASHKATPRNCQKQTKPRSGGFAVPHLATGLTNSAVVHESRLVGNRWIAAASATGTATSSTVTSFQYCRS
jgi:hypothetical protein